MIRYLFWLFIVAAIIGAVFVGIVTSQPGLLMPYMLLGMPAAYHLGKAGQRIRGTLTGAVNRAVRESPVYETIRRVG